MTNPAIKEALNYEMLFSQDEVKRREYELQEKAIRDYNATMLYNIFKLNKKRCTDFSTSFLYNCYHGYN